MPVRSLVCGLCLERDGVVSQRVVEQACTNDKTGAQFRAFVCVNCLKAGRLTRATCRTFVPFIGQGAPAPARDPVRRIPSSDAR
jgi:hypothetical protein